MKAIEFGPDKLAPWVRFSWHVMGLDLLALHQANFAGHTYQCLNITITEKIRSLQVQKSFRIKKSMTNLRKLREQNAGTWSCFTTPSMARSRVIGHDKATVKGFIGLEKGRHWSQVT